MNKDVAILLGAIMNFDWNKLEWSGQHDCAPSRMGGQSDYALPACPFCDGVQPTPEAKLNFIKEAIGHQESCPYLERNIKRIEDYHNGTKIVF